MNKKNDGKRDEKYERDRRKKKICDCWELPLVFVIPFHLNYEAHAQSALDTLQCFESFNGIYGRCK